MKLLSQTIEILKNIAVIDGSRKNIKQADVKSGECNKSDGNINNDTYNVLERSRVKFTYGSEVKNNNHSCSYNIDYSDISGQEAAKRATMIAVSGMHNIMIYRSTRERQDNACPENTDNNAGYGL